MCSKLRRRQEEMQNLLLLLLKSAFRFLKTRRLRSLLEDSIGWKFQENSAGDGVQFDEDDEVHELRVDVFHYIMVVVVVFMLNCYICFKSCSMLQW